MRKALSILLILLANMLILVHNVVPHHHHYKLFVSVVRFLDKGSGERLDHFHNTITFYHAVPFSKVDLMEDVRASLPSVRLPDCGLSDSDTYVSDIGIPLYGVESAVLSLSGGEAERLPSGHIPYVTALYSDWGPCSIGLRAPPCI